MPIPYYLYEVRRFPETNEFGTKQQLNLLQDNEYNFETSVTEVKLTDANFHGGLNRYLALHEFVVKLSFVARARGTTFREFVSPYKFPIYLENEIDNEKRYLIVQTKHKVSRDFVNRLNKEVSDFAVKSLITDIDSIRKTQPVIKGAWFRDMKAAYISSTGVFGFHVDKSDEFKHAAELGTLRALYIELEVDENNYLVMITADGGIILFDAFADEEEGEALDVVIEAKNALDGYLSVK